MTSDLFAQHAPGLASPPSHAFAITPDDATDLATATRGLMVGGSGDVAVITVGGESVTLPGLIAGAQYAIRVRRVLSAGTTATNMVGLA